MSETIILSDIAFAISASQLAQTVHLRPPPDGEQQDWDDLTALATRLQAAGRPKAIFREGLITNRQDARIVIDNQYELHSQALAKFTAQAKQVWFYCATCGREAEENAGELDFLQQYWLEEIKLIMLRAARQKVAIAVQTANGGLPVSSLGPGSGDAGLWEIQELATVFQALGDEAVTQIGVCLTDSMLMLPNKSVAGVFFQTQRDITACQLCQRHSCINRRAPFDHVLNSSLKSSANRPSCPI